MSYSAALRFPLAPQTVGIAAAVTTILIWVSFIIIARASASHTLLAMDIVFARYIGAGVALLPWAWWSSRGARRAGTHSGSLLGFSPLPFRITALSGLFGGLGYAGFAYTGFFFAPAAHASILLPGSLPFWTALLSVIMLGDRIPRARVVGLALILGGCLLGGITSLMNTSGGGQSWIGDLCFASAALCWSCYGVLLRKHSLDAVAATTALTAFTCLVFLPIYLMLVLTETVPSRLGVASWQELVFQAGFQGIGSVVISGISFALMVRHFGPVRSTMLTALVPGLSAIGAALLLGESLHASLVIGLALVTLGILVGVQRTRPPPEAPLPDGSGAALAVPPAGQSAPTRRQP
jgi:drug/metabolite transporter (DMT)-like permease